jgi:hypothetical protein
MPPFVSLKIKPLSFVLSLALSAACGASEPTTRLEAGFLHPPDSARPWVYGFLINGNVASNGLTADLEALKRVGLGGLTLMEVDETQGAPAGPVEFGSPAWRALFKHICAEAQRLGLEINMNNDSGWTGSGGPWITPELAMQKVVWSETNVAGPRQFNGRLAEPRKVAGYYHDIAVLAFPTPAVESRINRIEAKAAFAPKAVALRAHWLTLPADHTIPRNRLLELTAHLGADGQFRWEVPPGQWTILRLGHTPTGKDNHPAPKAGRGLECDKLNPRALDVMFAGLMGKLTADAGRLVGKSLVATHIDSWEVGSQNWTPRFREEFRRLRGYDPLPFLPTMTGRVVDSLEISERFLWDLRQTISDLLLENYAGHMHELANRHGLRLTIEGYTECPTDEMAYAARADEPMGEFWSSGRYGEAFSCTEMASAAHVYGKRIVGAEAFTADEREKWLSHPATIKELGDWAFCEGINRFVFHRYAIQPWADVRPGTSMGPWGLHYERTQTWWEQSKAWHEYLSRCQFLLRQGLFVADMCLLAPEGSPSTIDGQQSFLSRPGAPNWFPRERPAYNFDTCPPEALLTRMSVKNGRLVLPDGMSYRLLVLPQTETMTPKLLRKVKDLVQAGATVMGARPLKSPSLSDYPTCDQELKALADELWGTEVAPPEFTKRPCGKGWIVWGRELEDARQARDESAHPFSHAKWIWHQEAKAAWRG